MRTELSNIPDTSSRRAEHGTTPAPAPHLIGVGVDGTSAGRDAVVLASILARATGADLRVRQLIDTTPRCATQALQGLCADVNLLVLGADPSPSPRRAPLARATRKLLNDAPTRILIAPRSAHAPAV